LEVPFERAGLFAGKIAIPGMDGEDAFLVLIITASSPKKKEIVLPVRIKTVPLQADYYPKKIRD
jgi:hypothetical protein